jgi:membrane protease YdiL (CAAX protease family)
VKRGLPITYILAFGWTMAAAFFLTSLHAASIAFRASAATDIVNLGAIEALVFVGGTFVLLQFHARDLPLRQALGLRPTHPALSVLGVLVGVALHYPAESVDVLVQRVLPIPAEELAARAALLRPATPGGLVVVVVVVACVAPLVEEMFFRGALYGGLRRSNALLGTCVVSAACFVVGHLDYRTWPALSVVAVAMTYLRAVSGSLFPSLATHVTFNAVSVLSIAVGGIDPSEPTKIALLPTACGWIVTIALMFAVRYVAVRAAAARRGRAEDAE